MLRQVGWETREESIMVIVVRVVLLGTIIFRIPAFVEMYECADGSELVGKNIVPDGIR